jgi:hypothetical protein
MYTIDPTINAATIDSKKATIVIASTATFNGRMRSLTATARSAVW